MINRPINVLLIEDSPDDATLILEMLAEANGPGFRVERVDCLWDGLERLAQNGIDFLLLDLSLPDSVGLPTFLAARTQAHGVPIVVLTGLDDETVAATTIHAGAQDYLIKGEVSGSLIARSIRHAIERHRVLEELDHARKKQLRLKDEFLSHVSHELRSPLSVVHQFVTIPVDGLAGDLSPEQREYLGIALENVNRLRRMIDELLEVTRAETGKLTVEAERTSVTEVIANTLNTFRISAEEKAICLSSHVSDVLPPALADPERLRQILTNLIDNAIKFTPEGGTVTIRAGFFEKDKDFLCVSVADTGRGISPAAAPRIFDRFYQESGALEGHRKGLGLGLYICRELVSRHRGRIWVESRPGQGSVFSFTLPVFSLPRLLFPILIENGRLRSPVALIRIKLFPRAGSPANRIRETVLQQARDIVEGCVRRDLGMVLPRMDPARDREIFLVLACTDRAGAEVVADRIREQLWQCQAVRDDDIGPAVSVTIMQPAPQGVGTPVEELVEEVASKTASLTTTAVAAGGDGHGQGKNPDRG